jgi:hypothetical protein
VSNFNAAIDGLESLILAHACCLRIDVTIPAYLEGIETAVEAIVNNFGDDNMVVLRSRPNGEAQMPTEPPYRYSEPGGFGPLPTEPGY